MTAEQISISSHLELTVHDAEKKYLFYERSGMNLSDGMSLEEADRAAYLEVFGIEFDQ